jgi:hypothetical protein
MSDMRKYHEGQSKGSKEAILLELVKNDAAIIEGFSKPVLVNTIISKGYPSKTVYRNISDLLEAGFIIVDPQNANLKVTHKGRIELDRLCIEDETEQGKDFLYVGDIQASGSIISDDKISKADAAKLSQLMGEFYAQARKMKILGGKEIILRINDGKAKKN